MSNSILKSIKTEDVKMGMFIHDLKLSWWEHSFVLPRFLIDSKELLEKVRQCGSAEIIIDEEKSNYKNEDGLLNISKDEQKNVAKNESINNINISELTPKKIIKVSYEEEFAVASKIVKQAKKAVMKAMEEARTGSVSSVEQIYQTSEHMVNSVSRNSSALLSLAGLKVKDDYTFMHCVSVGVFMIALGKKLGFNEKELCNAGVAGLLHDIGKGFMPDNILNKPGKLTDKEMEIMRSHPELGYKVLRESGYTNEASLDVVLHHHERLDGQGYPEKLNSSNISTLARMGAITDVYDAVTSNRVYHRAIPPTAALKMLLESGGRHFDANITKAFISVIGLYPNNSLVKLSSDKLAIVLEQDETNIACPKVCVMFSVKHNHYLEPQIVYLSKSKDKIILDIKIKNQ